MQAPGFGYTIEVPDGWATQPRQAAATDAVRLADLLLRRSAPDPDYRSRISVTYERVGVDVDEPTLLEMVRVNRQSMADQHGARVYSMLPATFGGVRGYGFDFDVLLDGNSLEIRQVAVVTSGIAYFVQLAAPPRRRASNIPALRKVMQSWLWTGVD